MRFISNPTNLPISGFCKEIQSPTAISRPAPETTVCRLAQAKMKSSIINARGAETAPAGMIELFLWLFFPFFPRISTRRDAELIFEAADEVRQIRKPAAVADFGTIVPETGRKINTGQI